MSILLIALCSGVVGALVDRALVWAAARAERVSEKDWWEDGE